MIIKWLSRYCKACTGTKWHITFSSAISNFTLLDPVPYSIQTAKKLITTNIYWCLDEQTPSITKGGSGSRAYSGGQTGKRRLQLKARSLLGQMLPIDHRKEHQPPLENPYREGPGWSGTHSRVTKLPASLTEGIDPHPWPPRRSWGLNLREGLH